MKMKSVKTKNGRFFFTHKEETLVLIDKETAVGLIIQLTSKVHSSKIQQLKHCFFLFLVLCTLIVKVWRHTIFCAKIYL